MKESKVQLINASLVSEENSLNPHCKILSVEEVKEAMKEEVNNRMGTELEKAVEDGRYREFIKKTTR